MAKQCIHIWLRLGLFAGGLALVSFARPAFAVERPATSPATSQAAADSQKIYDDLFGGEEKKVGTNGKSAARFAQKLDDALGSVSDDKELSALLCEKTIMFGLRDPDGFKSASDAMKKLIELQPERAESLRARQIELYRQIYARGRPGPDRNEAGATMLHLSVQQAEEFYKAHRYVEALKAYRDASTIATTIKSPQADELAARAKETQSKVQIADKAKSLTDRIAQQPTDATLRRQLMEVYLLEMNDPETAARNTGQSLGAEMESTLHLATMKPDEISQDDLLTVGRLYRDLAPHASVAGKPVALVRALTYFDRWLENHDKKDADRLKVTAEADAVGDQLSVLGMGTRVDRIVIWNTHNFESVDRGAREINVVLLLGGKTIWRRESVEIDWSPEKCVSVELRPTAVYADTLRIEIVTWRGNGGGLSEVQAFGADGNLCTGGKTSASASFDGRFTPANLNDGKFDEPGKKGYWLLPDNRAGWAEVTLGEDRHATRRPTGAGNN